MNRCKPFGSEDHCIHFRSAFRLTRRWFSLALSSVVLLAFGVSVIWRPTLGACDYIAQAGIIILALVAPFINARERRAGWHLAKLFFLGVAWTFWRMAWFDSLTHNDVPGGIYLYVIAVLTIISGVLYMVRRLISWAYSALQSRHPSTVAPTEVITDGEPR